MSVLRRCPRRCSTHIAACLSSRRLARRTVRQTGHARTLTEAAALFSGSDPRSGLSPSRRLSSLARFPEASRTPDDFFQTARCEKFFHASHWIIRLPSQFRDSVSLHIPLRRSGSSHRHGTGIGRAGRRARRQTVSSSPRETSAGEPRISTTAIAVSTRCAQSPRAPQKAALPRALQRALKARECCPHHSSRCRRLHRVEREVRCGPDRLSRSKCSFRAASSTGDIARERAGTKHGHVAHESIERIRLGKCAPSRRRREFQSRALLEAGEREVEAPLRGAQRIIAQRSRRFTSAAHRTLRTAAFFIEPDECFGDLRRRSL